MGVAISASLLPPAVNCGLFWSVSLVSAVYDEDTIKKTLVGHQSWVFDNKTNVTAGGYQARYYEDNLTMEFFALGLVSLTLTLINILCIIITGVLILRLKEVTATKVPQKFQGEFCLSDRIRLFNSSLLYITSNKLSLPHYQFRFFLFLKQSLK